jgi:DNA primase
MAKLGASPGLLNSSMMKRGHARIPLREAALVIGVLNHPAILQRFFEEFVDLPLSSTIAGEVRQRIIDLVAEKSGSDEQITAVQLRATLFAEERDEVISRMEKQLSQNRIWQCDLQAAFEDAVEGWRQAYALHIRSHGLHRELKAAEHALASDDSEENLERLLHIQSEIAKDEGIEALIDGFGVSSGRPSRSF